MEQREKMIIDELREENRLLRLKVDAYKEELESLSSKLDYSQRFIVLYESIIDASREEIKELSLAMKKHAKSSNNKDKNVKKTIAKKSIVKKQIKKTTKKSK